MHLSFSGVSKYIHKSSSKGDRLSKIFIPVKVHLLTQAVIDTGGGSLIIPPDMHEILLIDLSIASKDEIQIRGTPVKGYLFRFPLWFIAEEGEHLEVDVTAFMPNEDYKGRWALPVYVGWTGCLERLRCAFDPIEPEDYSSEIGGRFYFGARM